MIPNKICNNTYTLSRDVGTLDIRYDVVRTLSSVMGGVKRK